MAADPPSIVAIMSKLTGNVDPAKIFEFAPGELKNLPGYESAGDGGGTVHAVPQGPKTSLHPGRAYVTELWWHEGDTSYTLGPIKKARHARLSIFDKDGRVLARWGTPEACAPGSFAAPHGLAVDSKNDVYVSEVTWTFAVSRGRAPADCHTFQKFSLKP